MSNAVTKSKRRYLRYPPGPVHAEMDLRRDGPNAPFTPSVTALIVDESYAGCGLVVVERECVVKVGDPVLVKLGPIGAMGGVISWVRHLDDAVMRVGVDFTPGSTPPANA